MKSNNLKHFLRNLLSISNSIYKFKIFFPGVRYNFEMYRNGQASTLGYGYDKQSVMHYGK